MRILLLLGIPLLLLTTGELVAAGDVTATLAQYSEELPGPTIEIDFSKGDWWVGLFFYLLMQWMRQRGARR